MTSITDNEKTSIRPWVELHIAVVLFGFTAILGDVIQLTALVLVWWRVFFTSISLVPLVRFFEMLREIEKKDILRFMGIGLLVGLHWLTFYGAIKMSNASIALICLATTSFMTSILEPLLLGRRFVWLELLIGAIIIPGMYFIVDSVQVDMLNGIYVGLISALLASLFSIYNKKMIEKANPLRITFIELTSAWGLLSIIIPFYIYFSADTIVLLPSGLDLIYLLILALLCTTLAYVLALRSLKYISAFASNLAINLEPVYGILLAWWLLGDASELTYRFYLGCGIILASVFSYPILKKFISK